MKRINHFILKSTWVITAILFLSVSNNCTTTAQSMVENSQRTISINMSSTELIPADLIIFSININAEEKTPDAAFATHKKREAVLASLLKKFDIQEKDIKFQPIRINKRSNYNNREEIVTAQTSQQVSVSFADFEIYEKIQVTLIENGFDSFNGSFSSTKIDSGKDKALESAIEGAREKAEFIASKSGVQLGAIQTINYSDYQVNRPQMSYEAKGMMSTSDSMMDFAQTVSVTANISFVFQIEN
ncbi:MAG: SIMPL domain-containing protein [Balneola sp.]